MNFSSSFTHLEEMKAKDAVEIDVRGKTSIADYLVVASGTSSRHVKSVADEVVRFAKKCGVMPLGVEGGDEAEWVLVDLGDVIVHVMLPRVREYYAIERLWTVGDQPPEHTPVLLDRNQKQLPIRNGNTRVSPVVQDLCDSTTVRCFGLLKVLPLPIEA